MYFYYRSRSAPSTQPEIATQNFVPSPKKTSSKQELGLIADEVTKSSNDLIDKITINNNLYSLKLK